MPVARLLLLLIALIALPATAQAPGSFSARILAAHNAERARIGLAALRWNPELATQAQVWARELAVRGALQHDRNRAGAGENLWMGTSGHYSPEAMIDTFVAEARHFRPGRFPDVSRTGRWQDVGHYTQVIWPATQELGCALAEGRGQEILVCRYFPSGNWTGQQVP